MKRYPTTAVALIVATLLLASSQTVQAKNNWLRQNSAESRKHYRAVQHQETPPGDPFKDDPAPGSKSKKKKPGSPEEVKFYEGEPEALRKWRRSQRLAVSAPCVSYTRFFLRWSRVPQCPNDDE